MKKSLVFMVLLFSLASVNAQSSEDEGTGLTMQPVPAESIDLTDLKGQSQPDTTPPPPPPPPDEPVRLKRATATRYDPSEN